jgi:hypothetical protein
VWAALEKHHAGSLKKITLPSLKDLPQKSGLARTLESLTLTTGMGPKEAAGLHALPALTRLRLKSLDYTDDDDTAEQVQPLVNMRHVEIDPIMVNAVSVLQDLRHMCPNSDLTVPQVHLRGEHFQEFSNLLRQSHNIQRTPPKLEIYDVALFAYSDGMPAFCREVIPLVPGLRSVTFKMPMGRMDVTRITDVLHSLSARGVQLERVNVLPWDPMNSDDVAQLRAAVGQHVVLTVAEPRYIS